MRKHSADRPLYLTNAEQFRALCHPQRHDILSVLLNRGASTIKEVAEEMGCSPTSLYRHVDRLHKAGIVREAGTQPGPRRDAVLYEVPGTTVRSTKVPMDEAYKQQAARSVRLELRSAERDVEREVMNATPEDDWRKDGRVGYITASGWLDKKQLKELRSLMEKMETLLERSPKREGTKRYKAVIVYRQRGAGAG